MLSQTFPFLSTNGVPSGRTSSFTATLIVPATGVCIRNVSRTTESRYDRELSSSMVGLSDWIVKSSSRSLDWTSEWIERAYNAHAVALLSWRLRSRNHTRERTEYTWWFRGQRRGTCWPLEYVQFGPLCGRQRDLRARTSRSFILWLSGISVDRLALSNNDNKSLFFNFLSFSPLASANAALPSFNNWLPIRSMISRIFFIAPSLAIGWKIEYINVVVLRRVKAHSQQRSQKFRVYFAMWAL